MSRADELTERYGGTTVLHGLDFTLHPGTVTGFLGPDGPGAVVQAAFLQLGPSTRSPCGISGIRAVANGDAIVAPSLTRGSRDRVQAVILAYDTRMVNPR
ncbi:hypothetical protein [Streptomyces sp. NPDC088746]|uniref:hypothetical protein n=1 Tax=Streptomyces sp. NPDC088746 TaxID=3365885 RepID=UPI0038115C98